MLRRADRLHSMMRALPTAHLLTSITQRHYCPAYLPNPGEYGFVSVVRTLTATRRLHLARQTDETNYFPEAASEDDCAYSLLSWRDITLLDPRDRDHFPGSFGESLTHTRAINYVSEPAWKGSLTALRAAESTAARAIDREIDSKQAQARDLEEDALLADNIYVDGMEVDLDPKSSVNETNLLRLEYFRKLANTNRKAPMLPPQLPTSSAQRYTAAGLVAGQGVQVRPWKQAVDWTVTLEVRLDYVLHLIEHQQRILAPGQQ